jgi:hypothetical protein
VPSRTSSITEIIAACGWETWAPLPGRHSFTNTLIEVLEDWIERKSFSAAMLHCEVLSVLRQSRPRRNREISKTPIYIVSTSNPKTCSIELARRQLLAPDAAPVVNSKPSLAQSQVTASPKTDAAESTGEGSQAVAANEEDKFNLSSLSATLPDKTFVFPHVILSVALEEDQVLDLDGFQHWIELFPALAKYAKIEGVYPSHSTLLLLTVPVVVWNMLPDNPAFNFVGYARSGNLLESTSLVPFANSETLPRVVEETSKDESISKEAVRGILEAELGTTVKEISFKDILKVLNEQHLAETKLDRNLARIREQIRTARHRIPGNELDAAMKAGGAEGGLKFLLASYEPCLEAERELHFVVAELEKAAQGILPANEFDVTVKGKGAHNAIELFFEILKSQMRDLREGLTTELAQRSALEREIIKLNSYLDELRKAQPQHESKRKSDLKPWREVPANDVDRIDQSHIAELDRRDAKFTLEVHLWQNVLATTRDQHRVREEKLEGKIRKLKDDIEEMKQMKERFRAKADELQHQLEIEYGRRWERERGMREIAESYPRMRYRSPTGRYGRERSERSNGGW